MNRRALLPLFLLIAAAASASTVLRVDFNQLSRLASNVVSGRVVEIETEVDERGYIWSNVTIAVSRAEPSLLEGRRHTFRMLGGESGGRRLSIQGMPQFSVGESVALFLNGKTANVFGPTVGLWQGVFYIEKNPLTGGEVMLDSQRRPITGVREGQLQRAPQALPKQGWDPKAFSAEGSSPISADRFFEEVRASRGAAATR